MALIDRYGDSFRRRLYVKRVATAIQCEATENNVLAYIELLEATRAYGKLKRFCAYLN